MNARIADLIREGRPDEITDAIGEGEYFGMQTFEQALIDRVARRMSSRRTSPPTPPRNKPRLPRRPRPETKRRAEAAAGQPADTDGR